MAYLYTITTLLLMAAFSYFLWDRSIKNRAHKNVNDELISTAPLWAALGPFRDGEDSAKAWKAAYTVVTSAAKAESRSSAFDAHRQKYDESPEEMEEGRLKLLSDSEDLGLLLIMAKKVLEGYGANSEDSLDQISSMLDRASSFLEEYKEVKDDDSEEVVDEVKR